MLSATTEGVSREDGFLLTEPEYYNFALDVFDVRALKHPERTAMVWVNQKGENARYNFDYFRRKSNRLANYFTQKGIQPGDFVFILLPRLHEWWIISLALSKIGAVQSSSPTLLLTPDIEYRIQDGKFVYAITDAENAPKFSTACANCPTLRGLMSADGAVDGFDDLQTILNDDSIDDNTLVAPFKAKSTDPFLVAFTSGTSKHPKMVLHKYSYPIGHRITAELWHGISEGDLHFTVSDTGWAKNLWGNYFGQWNAGATLFIYDIRGKFHAEELLPLFAKYQITSFCAPPTIYRMMVTNDLSAYDLSSLRHCTTAGEPMHTETVRVWQANTGMLIREGYGQTETVALIGNFLGHEPCIGAMGKSAPGWDIEIHDDAGNVVAHGEDGRIAVRIKPTAPVGLFVEYHDNPEENAKSFEGDFYYPGDKARLDENGYFWFIGRTDDIIKSSGYRIGPLEVEEVLMQHPSVLEVAIIGTPDDMRGALVKAYIVLKEGFDPSDELKKELQTFVKTNTAPYKYPRLIDFVEALPKTFSGKVKRDLLRKHTLDPHFKW